MGFKHQLKSLTLRKSDDVESMVRISFLFQVQAHIDEEFNFAPADSSTKVVYVKLRGQEEQYEVSNDKNSFDIC